MDKAVYIHGLGGSGTGKSASLIKKSLIGLYDVEASTYNHLDPLTTFEQIKNDIKGARLIIASSLGAFYALSLNTDIPTLLLNPCVCPEKTIEGLLYEEQKKLFDKEKCYEEWALLKESWKNFDNENKHMKFGVFSDNDEYFSFYNEFLDSFANYYDGGRCNASIIEGTHEIAKHNDQLARALNKFWHYMYDISDGYYSKNGERLEESHLTEKYLNMWFNADARNDALINENFSEIWDILDKAYAYTKNNVRGKGGPNGFKNALELYNDCKNSNALIKAIKSNGHILAVAIYNLKRGGRKLSLIGADSTFNGEKYVCTPEGKDALYKIIKEDISQSNRNFWGEVSDAAEIAYYVKTNAVAIPPSVVDALMPDKNIRDTNKHEAFKDIIDKASGKTHKEINRFDSGYYERDIDGRPHRKVAITSPDNVGKVKSFPIETYKGRK